MFKKIRSNLAMGLIVMLPAILTIYVLQFIYNIIDPILGTFLSNILVTLHFIPQFPVQIPWVGITLQNRVPGIGIIVTFILLIAVGITTKSLLGKQLIRLTEMLFSKIPIARGIYSTVHQIVNAFTQDKSSFKKVVLVEYPRNGLYTMGFLTGEGQGEFTRKFSNNLVNVFLPTTPNPTSGWLALVPKEDVIVLEMSVEEGLKYIISGGVVYPPDKSTLEPNEYTNAQEVN